jgi:hypothetical protein
MERFMPTVKDTEGGPGQDHGMVVMVVKHSAVLTGQEWEDTTLAHLRRMTEMMVFAVVVVVVVVPVLIFTTTPTILVALAL